MKHLALLGSLPSVPENTLPSNPSDTDLGTFALSAFWRSALSLGSQVPADWSGFLEVLRRAYYPRDASEAPVGYPKAVFYPNKSEDALAVFIDGLGMSLRSVGFDQDTSKITTAMDALASRGGGTVPVNQNSFFGVIQDSASQVNFFDAAAFVAQESASQIVQAAQDVGDSVIDTAQSVMAYKNEILIGVGLLAVALVYVKFVGFKSPMRKNPKSKKHRRNAERLFSF